MLIAPLDVLQHLEAVAVVRSTSANLDPVRIYRQRALYASSCVMMC